MGLWVCGFVGLWCVNWWARKCPARVRAEGKGGRVRVAAKGLCPRVLSQAVGAVTLVAVAVGPEGEAPASSPRVPKSTPFQVPGRSLPRCGLTPLRNDAAPAATPALVPRWPLVSCRLSIPQVLPFGPALVDGQSIMHFP